MPSHSNIIPDCQSPANDAAGVVAAKPDAGGGVGPSTPAHVDCMGTPLMAGDTVEVLGLGDVVIDALIVDEWGMLRFVYGSRTQPAICCKLLHRPVAAVAAPTAGRGLGPYTPATVYRAFELLSHAHDMLTRCPLPLGPAGHDFIADIATLLEDADRQRMNAAAAHALGMQR